MTVRPTTPTKFLLYSARESGGFANQTRDRQQLGITESKLPKGVFSPFWTRTTFGFRKKSSSRFRGFRLVPTRCRAASATPLSLRKANQTEHHSKTQGSYARFRSAIGTIHPKYLLPAF